MAEQVDIPAVGPVDKRVLYVVGGSGLAFVIYRYWKARQSSGIVLDPSTGSLGGGLSYANPAPSSSGGNPAANPAPTNNQEWTQLVIERMGNIGKDAGFVSTVIGKYLANAGLTSEEGQVVQEAWALAGKPPQGPLTFRLGTGGGGAPGGNPGTGTQIMADGSVWINGVHYHAGRWYDVQQGENWASIGAKFGRTADQLAQANKDRVPLGQQPWHAARVWIVETPF
jgi:hypothetical protein